MAAGWTGLPGNVMSKSDRLRYGPPGESAVHICVDMQRMFAEGTEWKMPWLERVLPNIIAVTSAHCYSACNIAPLSRGIGVQN